MPEHESSAVLSETGAVTFGPFQLFPKQRRLLADGTQVPLGSRALEILILLVERAGEMVGRDEILARVWSGLSVDESNLRVHISGLRKALGERRLDRRYIVNSPSKGYSFIGPLTTAEPKSHRAGRPENLPVRLLPVLGRESSIAAIAADLQAHRFVTISGPGGIGKTTVAIAVAEHLADSYGHGVVFADFGALAHPDLVAGSVGAAFGAPPGIGDPLAALLAFLRERHALILLDSCEPVIDAAASLVEAMLKAAPRLHVLATSREPLRAEGERTYRLSPMEIPPAGRSLTARSANDYSAIRLFVDRAVAAHNGFVLTDRDVPLLADICRRLDGIPLAIELAAPQAAQLGLRGLTKRLDNRFALLLRGRRTALPRHQTLRATLDWSYDLLPELERTTLRRAAIFFGSFTAEAAGAMEGAADSGSLDVIGSIANLVSKSLVASDPGDGFVSYRLLDTTRAYALRKLQDSGEFETIARRHALYYCALFERAACEWEMLSVAGLLSLYGSQINNVRAALDWAFSSSGDASIGVALTIATVPLWVHLSQMHECHMRVAKALASGEFDANPPSRSKMRLLGALGAALHYTKSPVAESGPVWTATLEIADALGDVEYQLGALWGLWNQRTGSGDHRAALAVARKFHHRAARGPDPAVALIGDRIMGVSLHYLGYERKARRHIEHMLDQYVPPANGSHTIRFQTVQRITARSNLSWILWVQGLPERAMRMACGNVAHAEADGHALSLCHALEAMCLVALHVGDRPAAERAIGMLRDHTSRYGVGRWDAWGRCFEGALLSKAGNSDAGLRLLEVGLDDLRKTGFVLRFNSFLGEFAEALSRSGQDAAALTAVEEALARCERTGNRWCVPELLRIKGDVLLQRGASDAVDVAKKYFLQSIDRARRQGALSWELRAATSLARLHRRHGDSHEARNVLGPVHDRFTEGFDTSDLIAARALLAAI